MFLMGMTERKPKHFPPPQRKKFAVDDSYENLNNNIVKNIRIVNSI